MKEFTCYNYVGLVVGLMSLRDRWETSWPLTVMKITHTQTHSYTLWPSGQTREIDSAARRESEMNRVTAGGRTEKREFITGRKAQGIRSPLSKAWNAQTCRYIYARTVHCNNPPGSFVHFSTTQINQSILNAKAESRRPVKKHKESGFSAMI